MNQRSRKHRLNVRRRKDIFYPFRALKDRWNLFPKIIPMEMGRLYGFRFIVDNYVDAIKNQGPIPMTELPPAKIITASYHTSPSDLI